MKRPMQILQEILLQRDPEAQDLPLPSYATAGAAGMDLHAALAEPLYERAIAGPAEARAR